MNIRMSFVGSVLVELGICLTCYCYIVECRYNVQAQFKVCGEQVKAREKKLEAVVAGITPVLDCISFEPPKGTSHVAEPP